MRFPGNFVRAIPLGFTARYPDHLKQLPLMTMQPQCDSEDENQPESNKWATMMPQTTTSIMRFQHKWIYYLRHKCQNKVTSSVLNKHHS